MLTAAVRDLHLQYPGRFVTDVRTPCPELWEHNPFITPLQEGDPGVEVISCHYPLINRCNLAPYHCLHGFIDFLNSKLGLRVAPSVFRGDIHLSDEERNWFSQVHELTGEDTPFWIIVAGGKFDVTIKWWDINRFQEVVDHFRNKIQFVQIGEAAHYHPPLNGVIDLRGKTDLRQLVRLVHHAQGVLCPVTCLMHLAAAVETKPGQPVHRPCVVVAGGREPVHWEAYPHHQFVHTIGALPCCATGGCWKSRVRPLGDGDPRDKPGALCVDVRGHLPRCMDMIPSADIIRRIELYFEGGACCYLGAREARRAWRAVSYAAPENNGGAALTEHNARLRMERYLAEIPEYPGVHRGRGIVIAGGGVTYFTNAWVCIRMLRKFNCRLPVEFWHLGEDEVDASMAAILERWGVRCIDALKVRRRHSIRILNGWELKAYALLHSRFREALLLDADNVPVRDPEYLFDAKSYQATGSIFWPDFERWQPGHPIWGICGIPYRDEPEFESGQIVVDKKRCWKALHLALWINENSDFFYRHIHGDKDTFRIAWHKAGQAWSMPGHKLRRLEHTMCQHDFQGRRIFQHRNFDKWDIFLRNKKIKGFRHEKECVGFIRELQQIWNGRLHRYRPQERNGRPPGRRARANKPLVIAAHMLSCPERTRLRRRTLRNLAATDWGDGPVRVQIDDRPRGSPVENQCRNAFLLLKESLQGRDDYILFLEDDLEFNVHFLGNLMTWRPLLEGNVTLASFFNPGIQPLACDLLNHCLVGHPWEIRGSLAYILSRDTATYVVENWESEGGAHDIRIPRLARRMKKPLLVHCPSLVYHVGYQSTWDENFHQAIDFDRTWRRPREAPLL